jgi:AbiV family abortive infection protein
MTHEDYPAVPDAQTLFATAKGAVLNAARQLDASELLLANGHVALANGVATLAYEELGKAFLCVMTFSGVPSGPVDEDEQRKAFWRPFRDHEPKGSLAELHRRMFLSAEPPPEVLAAVKESDSTAKAANTSKERSFYVEIKRGRILTPEKVSEKTARRMVANVRVLLGYFEPVVDIMDLPVALQVLQTTKAWWESDGQRIRAEYAGDDERLLLDLRSMLAGIREGRGLPESIIPREVQDELRKLVPPESDDSR